MRDYVNAIRDRWVSVVVAVVLGALLGGAAGWFAPTQYTAKTVVYYAFQGDPGTEFSAYEGNLLAQQNVRTGEALATTDRVAQQVVQRLNLDMTSEELSRRLTATADLDSVMLTISATDASPTRAADIAGAAGDVLMQSAKELEPAPDTVAVSILPKVVQPPTLETALAGPARAVAFAAAGLLAGLLVGIGIAVLRARTDTSVRSVETLELAGGMPVLATTFEDRIAPDRPLSVLGEGDDERAEAYRRLRVGLERARSDSASAGTTVLVTSPLATVGRRLVVANLAASFAKSGRTVAVVEADLRTPRMASVLGVHNLTGLADALVAAGTSEPAEQPAPVVSRPTSLRNLSASAPTADATPTSSLARFVQSAMPGLDVLPAGARPANVGELLGSPAMAEVLAELRRSHDVVLIDAPPVLPVADAIALVPHADQVVLLCPYRVTTRGDVRAARQALERVAAPGPGTVLTTVLTMVPAAARGVRRYRIAESARPEPASSAARPPAATAESDIRASPPVAQPEVTPEPARDTSPSPAS